MCLGVLWPQNWGLVGALQRKGLVALVFLFFALRAAPPVPDQGSIYDAHALATGAFRAINQPLTHVFFFAVLAEPLVPDHGSIVDAHALSACAFHAIAERFESGFVKCNCRHRYCPIYRLMPPSCGGVKAVCGRFEQNATHIYTHFPHIFRVCYTQSCGVDMDVGGLHRQAQATPVGPSTLVTEAPLKSPVVNATEVWHSRWVASIPPFIGSPKLTIDK